MSLPSRIGAVALLAAALGGCQAISGALRGGGGVMPDTEVGPPPSAGTSLPGPQRSRAMVDADGAPLASAPTRRLDLPKNVRGETRSADAGPRRINRDEIDDNSQTASRSSGGLTPSLQNGNIGMGGKF